MVAQWSKGKACQYRNAFLGGGYAIVSLWIWSILILPRLAIQHHKDKKDKATNEGNQSNEYPPSTATSVVEPADCHRDTRIRTANE
jgi:hypothetical protein